ncbi:hypothetical protein ACFO1B_51600 [Dactylosporangium siamense]|uniref:HTH cro/C1-type domain-containing protein n=1 Tax=Dactylosporangium siamense TaxID=685454 RepID=A0A919PGG4_9ACTN|nr:hypothetical protein [Dactylosporangium siamense]GIG43732.1 hypothetical protein Dsi01nite_017730 [Dactylosporangium siamense]
MTDRGFVVPEPLPFAAALTRLLANRSLDVSDLARSAGLRTDRVAALLAGATPDAWQLRHMAAALHLHAADLFAIAGRPVPADLLPLERPHPSRTFADIAMDAHQLDDAGRDEVRAFIHALPTGTADLTRSWVTDRRHDRFRGVGGLVGRFLAHRNILSNQVRCLAHLTHADMYVSQSTIYMLTVGRVPYRPRYVLGLATLLAMRADDLAAVLRAPLPTGSPAPCRHALDAAALLPLLVRYPAAQVAKVADLTRRLTEDHNRAAHRYPWA